MRGRGLGTASAGLRGDGDRTAPGCRSRGSSEPRSAPSTATCTWSTASRCCSARASRRSRAPTVWSGSALSDGRTIDCDARRGRHRRHTAHACSPRRPGLPSTTGSLVDERAETCAPGVFAAGDVANAYHPSPARLRVEHWANALQPGPAAAREHARATERLRPRCRTSSPTSTTSAWSTPATRDRLGRGRLPRRPGHAASSSPSGSATGACWPA